MEIIGAEKLNESESSELIQIQGQVQMLSTVDIPNYPERVYQWLTGVLDSLIDFGQRHGHYGTINLTKDEYQWLDGILEKLIFSVGENEDHPLAPLMEFIIQLIANYEQAYVPKLTERFPELAEKTPIETASKSEQPASNILKQSDSELAAHAFFSIGFLLYHGNRVEEAISAYDTVIALKQDMAEAYYCRGVAKNQLDNSQVTIADFENAKSDLQIALELAKQKNNTDLKAFVENQLQQLDNSTS